VESGRSPAAAAYTSRDGLLGGLRRIVIVRVACGLASGRVVNVPVVVDSRDDLSKKSDMREIDKAFFFCCSNENPT
jgi:hypothetical protein